MKIAISTPIRRYDSTEEHKGLLQWSWGIEEKHTVRWDLDTTYGVDCSRSRLLKRAMAWGPDVLLMIDSDVVPRLHWRETLSVISQAFSRGFGLVISPTISITGQILVWAPKHQTPYGNPLDIPVGNAFEIGWGGLGFAAFKGNVLSKLKVLKTQTFVNGPPEPLYCIYTSGGSGEDHSLCDNFRDSTGLKVGADTRLLTDHFKLFGRPSWRGTDLMPRGFESHVEPKEA